MMEVEKVARELGEPLSLTLPREQWTLLVFAASAGAQQILKQFMDGKGHNIQCVIEYAHAVVALSDEYKKALGEPKVDVSAATKDGA